MKKVAIFFIIGLFLFAGLIVNNSTKSVAKDLHAQFLKDSFSVTYTESDIKPKISKEEAINKAYESYKEEFSMTSDIKAKATAEHVVKIPAGGGSNKDVWAVSIQGGKYNDKKFKDKAFTINAEIWVESSTGKVLGAVAYDSKELQMYIDNHK